MSNVSYYELAKLRSMLLCSKLIESAQFEVKEYREKWRETPVIRQGGRFSSYRYSSQIVLTDQDLSVNSMRKKLDELSTAFNDLSKEDESSIKEFLFSKNLKKAQEQTGDAIAKADSNAGKAFNGMVEAINKLMEKTGLAKVAKKAKKLASDLIDKAKENRAEIIVATAAAIGVTLGSAGTVAFFSLPNLFGIGGLFDGIAAILSKEGADAIVAAFAKGGLSQLAFSTSLGAAWHGLATILFPEVFKLKSLVMETLIQSLEFSKEVVKQGGDVNIKVRLL